MCSYNQVNNSQACQNSYLQNYLLKGELGFQGHVVSDWLGTHSGVASVLAGLDVTMPGDSTAYHSDGSFYGANLTIAVLNGTVPAVGLLTSTSYLNTRIVLTFLVASRRYGHAYHGWLLLRGG